jgi:hypothetical protein
VSTLSWTLGCSGSNPPAGGADATADDASGTMVDAGVASPAPCTTSSVEPVQASDFDQSCTVNAECATVGVGNACDPCTALCNNAAINFRAVPEYLARFPKTPAGSPSGASCTCPASFFACCRNGGCYEDLQCQIDLAEAGAAAGTQEAAAGDGAFDGAIDATTDSSASVEGGAADAGGDN